MQILYGRASRHYLLKDGAAEGSRNSACISCTRYVVPIDMKLTQLCRSTKGFLFSFLKIVERTADYIVAFHSGDDSCSQLFSI